MLLRGARDADLVCKAAAVHQVCCILYRRLSCYAKHLRYKRPENMDLYRHLSCNAGHLRDKTRNNLKTAIVSNHTKKTCRFFTDIFESYVALLFERAIINSAIGMT